jgi:hypothetical protein
LAHADHHALVSRATNDGRKDGSRRVVAGETSFDHTGTVIAHERGNFSIFSHVYNTFLFIILFFTLFKKCTKINCVCLLFGEVIDRRFKKVPVF